MSSDALRSPIPWRLSTRLAIAVVIPGCIIAWLLYFGSVQEEYIHTRNLRRLGEMADRISKQLQTYQTIIQGAPEQTQDPKKRFAGVGNLHPAEGECGEKMEVRRRDGEPRLLIVAGKNKCAEADLAPLVHETIRADAFESVILADRYGRVLYQSGGDVRLANVTPLFASVPRTKTSEPAKHEGTPKTSVAPNATQGPNDSLAVSTLHVVESIGDRKFGVFVQPMPAVFDGKANPEDDLLLIGLAHKQEVWSDSGSWACIVFLPFAVLLGVAILPLARFSSLSAAETLRRRDLAQIAAGTLGALTLFSFFGLYIYMKLLGDGATDEQLRKLAQSIGGDIKYELGNAVKQLNNIDTFAANERSTDHFRTGLFEFLPQGSVHYPIEFADWVDEKGVKNTRWSATGSRLNSVPVPDRNYFLDAKAKRLLQVKGIDVPFAIEHVLSRTTGDAVTMLAIPSEHEHVASVAIRLSSLVQPVLAQGFGFAIIDNTGTALFHSEPGRAFAENLFEECSGNPELRSIVERRMPAVLTANYGGPAHRMLVTPIPQIEELPWTLAVYREMTTARLTRIQALLDTEALFALYALLAAACVAAILLLPRRGGRIPRWSLSRISPSPRRSGYPYAAVAGALVLLIGWRALGKVGGPMLLYGALGLAAAFTAIGVIALRKPGGGRWIEPQWRRAALIPLAIALLAAAIGEWALALAAPITLLAAGLVLSRKFRTMKTARYTAWLDRAWLAWHVMFAVALCIAPVFFLGKFGLEYETSLRTRDTQWKLWNGERQRREKMWKRIDELPGAVDSKRKLLRDALYREPGVSAGPTVGSYGGVLSTTLLWPCETNFNRAPCPAAPAISETCASHNPGNRFLEGMRTLPIWVLAAVEWPSPESQVGPDARKHAMAPAANLWEWRDAGNSLALCSNGRLVAESAVPAMVFGLNGGTDSSNRAGWTMWCAFWAAIVLHVWWLRKLRLKLRLEGTNAAPQPPPYSELRDAGISRLLLRVPPGPVHQTLPRASLEFEHLEEHMDDEASRLGMLSAIEGAMRAEGRSIRMAGAIDPVHYLECGGGLLAVPPAPEELLRWRRVMSHFETRALDAPEGSAAPLRTESAAIWDTLALEEKRLLAGLATQRLVHPASAPIVRQLLASRVIRRRPGGRLDFSSTGFRRFVEQAWGPIAAARPADKAASGVRFLPILVLIGGLLLFLLQEEAATRMIGLVTSVTAGFETIRKQLFGAAGSPGK